MQRFSMVCLACLLFVACDDTGGTDAGTMNPDGATGDGGTDAGAIDAGFDAGFDAGPPLCGGVECGADEACVRNVCLDTCGVDLSGWGAALVASATPVSNFCRPAGARVAVTTGADPIIYDLTQHMDGSAFVYTVSRWTATPGSVVTPEEIAAHRVEPSPDWGTAVPLPGGYLAVNPSETSLLFGYSVFVSADPLIVPGELLVANISTGEIDARTAPGNFDAAWLGDDAFLVNGLGLGAAADGSGIYVSERGTLDATQVASGIGASSGSVVVTPEYFLAGGYGSGPLAFSLPRADLDTTLSTGSIVDLMVDGVAVEDSAGSPLSSMFSLLGDGRIVVAEFMGPLSAYTATFSGAGLTLDTTEVLSSDTSVLTGVLSAGPDRLFFLHRGGLLLVTM